MEQRIPYDIVYCASQDDEFPIQELDNGIPHPSHAAGAPRVDAASSVRNYRGWQCARDAKMPQAIVLRFPGNVELTRMRILSHESKIASKVGVWLFALNGKEMEVNPPSFRTIRFTKLGVLDFNDNEQSNHRSKERKTIHMKAVAYYVKLLFNDPYNNAYNKFHQVGVYCIECSGQILSRVRRHRDAELVVGNSNNNNNNNVDEGGFTSSSRSVENSHGEDRLESPRKYGQKQQQQQQQRGKKKQEQEQEHHHHHHHHQGEKTPPQQRPHNLGSHAQCRDDGHRSTSSGNRNSSPQKRHVSQSPPLTPLRKTIPHGSGAPAFRSVRILEFEEFFINRSEELLALKDHAVAVEDFDTAKECRNRMNLMHRRSKRIYKLEQDKVHAIIEEDFDAAKKVKRVMDAMIEKVYEDAQLPTHQPGFDPYECTDGSFNDNLVSTHRSNKKNSPSCSSATAAAGRGRGGRSKGRHKDGKTSRNAKYDDSSSSSSNSDMEEETEDDSENSDGHHHHHHHHHRHHGHRRQGKKNKKSKDKKKRKRSDSDGDISDDSGNTSSNDSSSSEVINDDDSEYEGNMEPLVSRHVQRMADMVRDLTHEIEEIDPQPGESNDGSGDNTPALVEKSKLQNWERQAADAIMAASCETEGPTVLGPGVKNTREALDLVSAVGSFTASSLFSKSFKLREASLDVLVEHMRDLYPSIPSVIEEAVLRFLDMNGYGLQDAIPNVVAAACAFIRMTLADEHKCLSSVLAPVVNLLPRLLCCASDANPRVREEALSTLTLCIKTPSLTNPTILTALFAEPVDKERRRVPSGCPRVHIARLIVFEQLVSIGRMGLRNFSDNVWNKLLLPCLNHQHQEVRDLALSITTQLVQDRKLEVKEKRLGAIDNATIRENIKAIIGEVRATSLSPALRYNSGGEAAVGAAGKHWPNSKAQKQRNGGGKSPGKEQAKHGVVA